MIRDDDAFARGVALFEAGRAWDAHEVWEDLWRVATGADRELLQGLIQAAAAVVQAQRGRWRGVAALVARARGHLEAAGAAELADALDAWAAARRRDPPPLGTLRR